MRSCKASRLKAVTTNTSWAVLARRAFTLCPPVMGVDTFKESREERPRTRLITAGVTVLMSGSAAKSFNRGMSPSMYVLWVITTRPMGMIS